MLTSTLANWFVHKINKKSQNNFHQIFLQDECLNHSDLTETEKIALTKHYADLRSEMSVDVKQLSERSQIKNLETTKLALERKLQKIQEDNRAMEKRFAEEKRAVDLIVAEGKDIKAEIRSFESQDLKSDKRCVVIISVCILNEWIDFLQHPGKHPETCHQKRRIKTDRDWVQGSVSPRNG